MQSPGDCICSDSPSGAGIILVNYVLKVIMYSRYCIQFTEYAKNDLSQLFAEDGWAAERFSEILEAIEADPSLMARLDSLEYGADGWNILGLEEEARKRHRYLWRLKIYRAKKYRMIYGIKRHGLKSDAATIVVLGFIKRGKAYDVKYTHWQNILAGYDEYCE